MTYERSRFRRDYIEAVRKKNKTVQTGMFNPRECVSAETVQKRIEWEKKLAIRQYEKSLDLKE